MHVTVIDVPAIGAFEISTAGEFHSSGWRWWQLPSGGQFRRTEKTAQRDYAI
jgi:hypothetical protein